MLFWPGKLSRMFLPRVAIVVVVVVVVVVSKFIL